ncbi:hypothetical protein [Leclercia adecarboxylata]|uniref:hypothetical protein n=1 Tax=Leclercia adecarboxylata TaxID=83655 RepID=UPI00254DF054|nr:hypothetical protein [Leclercia adecarboxylata]
MTANLKMTNQQLDHLAANLFDCGFGVSAQQVQSMVVEIQDSRKALEAAQQRWMAQDYHINQQADRIDSLEKTNSGLGKALGEAHKRIAELESECDKQGRHACELFDEVATQRQQIAELVAAGIITKVGE